MIKVTVFRNIVFTDLERDTACQTPELHRLQVFWQRSSLQHSWPFPKQIFRAQKCCIASVKICSQITTLRRSSWGAPKNTEDRKCGNSLSLHVHTYFILFVLRICSFYWRLSWTRIRPVSFSINLAEAAPFRLRTRRHFRHGGNFGEHLPPRLRPFMPAAQRRSWEWNEGMSNVTKLKSYADYADQHLAVWVWL